MRWNDDRMENAIKGASSVRSYGSALREAMDRLSRKVLGRCLDERYRTPGAYTGKKLSLMTNNIFIHLVINNTVH